MVEGGLEHGQRSSGAKPRALPLRAGFIRALTPRLARLTIGLTRENPMRLLINSLAVIGLLVSISSIFELYSLRINDAAAQGFSNVTLPFWALLGAGAAFVFGFIGRIIDRRVPMPASKISDFAIAGGLLCGALVLAVPFMFG